MIKNRCCRIDYPRALLLALMLSLAGLARAEPVQAPHVEAELIAETTQLTKNGDNWLALRLKPEEGWHVYWRNPGDSGLPTSIAWALPAGASAGDIRWPYPQRETLGGIVNYGYTDETLLLVPLQLAGTVAAGTTLNLQAKAKWLVCKDSCIPGGAELSLTRLVKADGAPEIDDQWRGAFAAARDRLPQPAPADWKAGFAIDAAHKDFTLAITGARISSAGSASFFPYEKNLINHSSPSRKANDAKRGLRISRTLSDYYTDAPEQVDGVLVLHDSDSDKAWEIHAQPGTVAAVPASAATNEDGGGATATAPDQESQNLALVLLFAFLGGLVLNLMPCVFPVLSFKAISLVEARGSTARKQRAHALAYTSGVLGTFLGLAGLLLVLRSAGSAIGWGFQLQQPAFVAAMIYLFFAMALSMSGIVEFGTRLMGVGSSLASAAGYRGSFFTGALAVAVASPCTAPFMGTALGYALGQPAIIALTVFVALGLGLAAPFLLIGFIPRLGRWLPKPGAWMTTFRQLMAFPLYLTVVWLLWVLDGLAGRDGAAVVLLGMTLIGFALWLWHRVGAVASLARYAALALAATTLAFGPATELAASSLPAVIGDAAAGGQFEPWSEERVAALRADGRTVFVDFTADWCLTCKINENGALASQAARQAFAEKKVALLRADWTHANPAITKTLEGFGRSGVPVYVVYPEGGAPRLLPQILTPSAVVESLTAR